MCTIIKLHEVDFYILCRGGMRIGRKHIMKGRKLSYMWNSKYIKRERYKTDWSFKFALKERILLYLLQYILKLKPIFDWLSRRRKTRSKIIFKPFYSYMSLDLLSIGFSYATQYILNLKRIFNWLSQRRKQNLENELVYP